MNRVDFSAPWNRCNGLGCRPVSEFNHVLRTFLVFVSCETAPLCKPSRWGFSSVVDFLFQSVYPQ